MINLYTSINILKGHFWSILQDTLPTFISIFVSALRIGLYEKVRNGYMDLFGVEAGLGWGMLGVRFEISVTLSLYHPLFVTL